MSVNANVFFSSRKTFDRQTMPPPTSLSKPTI